MRVDPVHLRCVVVHELAHSVTATRLGIRVKDIVLFLGLIGLARFRGDPRLTIADVCTEALGAKDPRRGAAPWLQ